MMPSSTFDTWLRCSAETSARRDVAGRYGGEPFPSNHQSQSARVFACIFTEKNAIWGVRIRIYLAKRRPLAIDITP